MLPSLLEFLSKLEQHKLSYRLEHNRDEAIMVCVAVPGERWEIEFFAGGEIEVERFHGINGVSSGSSAAEELRHLFKVFGGE